jgi:DeoR family transcriptional regulator, fructose operon transcriptional repressor
MFVEERKQRILTALHRRPTVRVAELSRALRVSTASIRRDLADLERAGLLRRTHGGAVTPRLAALEPTLAEKEDQYQAEKGAIAGLAAGFVQEGDTIFLDAGSTTRQIARELLHRRGITVVTNALNIAWELASSDLEIVLTGGQLRRGILSQVGPLAEQAIASLHMDILFLAANGVEIEKGVTTPSLIEAQTKRTMVARATRVILVADHTKFGRVTFGRICGVDQLHDVVTDDRLPPPAVKSIAQLGVKVHLASANANANGHRP